MTTSELSSLAGLLSVQIKMAERQGLDEIRISVPRAREILYQCTVERAKRGAHMPAEHDKRLDAIFGLK